MADSTPAALQKAWYGWRAAQAWRLTPLDLAAKVAEEAGEVLGATLKLDQHGRAATHPDHDRDHLAQEIGQLVGTILCLAEHFGIDPFDEATTELDRVRERFPAVEAVARLADRQSTEVVRHFFDDTGQAPVTSEIIDHHEGRRVRRKELTA